VGAVRVASDVVRGGWVDGVPPCRRSERVGDRLGRLLPWPVGVDWSRVLCPPFSAREGRGGRGAGPLGADRDDVSGGSRVPHLHSLWGVVWCVGLSWVSVSVVGPGCLWFGTCPLPEGGVALCLSGYHRGGWTWLLAPPYNTDEEFSFPRGVPSHFPGDQDYVSPPPETPHMGNESVRGSTPCGFSIGFYVPPSPYPDQSLGEPEARSWYT
jgi:hypothetical protein